MSMAMALNNVKKCYSKVPNSCSESIGGALGLDTMGQNCFQIAISQNILNFSFNLYKNILDFVDLTCILLGILPQKRWHNPSYSLTPKQKFMKYVESSY